jgi:hypothetical protein
VLTKRDKEDKVGTGSGSISKPRLLGEGLLTKEVFVAAGRPRPSFVSDEVCLWYEAGASRAGLVDL